MAGVKEARGGAGMRRTDTHRRRSGARRRRGPGM